jgi:hypothetical protein
LELPTILVIDLVSESEEVEILEPPPVPVVDLVSEDEKEVALPITPSLEEVESMDTSEDTEGELRMLEEFEGLDLSCKESYELARAKGKRVKY